MNLEVTLLRSTYDPDGRKTLQQAGSAQTNDRGEYRLFWVTPGRYYLSVAPSTRPLPGVPFMPGLNSNKYPRTFYPGTTDASSAVLIEIQPAKELGGMDFRLNEQPTYRVCGRVVDPSGSHDLLRGVSITIVPREPIVNTGVFGSGAPYNPADGTFELRDIPAGQYLIRAQSGFNGRFEPGQPPPVPSTATSFVDVRRGDVDGVDLTFVPPASISGRVTIDGRPANVRANVFLRPAVMGPAPGPPPRPPQWNPDGTFRIDGILTSEYRIDACCIGRPQYVP